MPFLNFHGAKLKPFVYCKPINGCIDKLCRPVQCVMTDIQVKLLLKVDILFVKNSVSSEIALS